MTATSSSYSPKTKPFAHQQEEFDEHKEALAWALFWEQGCGKTKPIIDTSAALYEEGKINGLLVVAPNGVHLNWIVDQLPTHLPDRLAKQTRTHVYQASKQNTKWHEEACQAIVAHKGFAVLAINYDAFRTKRCKKLAWHFLKKRRVFYVLDEAARIKQPKAKRTISVVASGKHAAYRRILTGTPVANSPFDVYAPVKFLDESFWHRYQLGTFAEFKTKFGVWETRHNGEREFPHCVAYKNLDELHDILKTISTRLTKDQVLDLPPKLYSKRYFELTKEQERLYREIRDEAMTILDSGEFVSAPLAITRLLRLQQITCGYIPPDDVEVLEPDGTPVQRLQDIPGGNPRLDLAVEVSEDLPHQAIIWSRFRRDIDKLCDALGSMGVVRYDGGTTNTDRTRAIEAFQAGDVKFFIANPSAAGEGLTLHAARTVMYYSNSFNLVERLQSEDRAHRIGQEHPVNYIDLVGMGTVDKHIVGSLLRKYNIASQITGDELREWL